MAIRKASDSNLTGKKYNDASAGATKIEDVPDAPTITGSPTRIHTGATVPFTAATTGGTPANYIIEATPGNVTATGATSPIQITGLNAGTSYTFKVRGSSTGGSGIRSNSTNAITAANAAYVLAATYNATTQYTVPSGVSELTVFSFGGGAGGSGSSGGSGGNAAAGIIPVTEGSQYTASVAAAGGTSNFGNQLSSNGAGSATSISNGNGSGNGGGNSTPGNAGGNVSKSGVTLNYGGGGGGGGNGGTADPENQWNGFGISAGGNGGGAGGSPYGGNGGGGGTGYNNCCPHSLGGSPGGTGGAGQTRGGGGGGGGNGGRNNYGGPAPGTASGGAGGAGQVIVYEYKVV
jgi:hypothetical protein